MHLTLAMQIFILHWWDMGAKWGSNRSVAQIHAQLHIAPDPPSADEICGRLNLARSVQMAASKLGGRIARCLPKGKDS